MKGETMIAAYVEAMVERESYKPREGEEQTPERAQKLLAATARVNTMYTHMSGGQVAEARRRLLVRLKP